MSFDPRDIEAREFEPYEEQHFAWLKRALQLTEQECGALKVGLRRSAQDWQFERLSLGRISAVEAKEFENLFKALRTTVIKLENVETESWRRLQEYYGHYIGHRDSPNLIFNDFDPRYPEIALKLEFDPTKREGISSCGLDDLAAILHDLSEIVGFGSSRFRQPKGPKRNYSLMNWLLSIASIWESNLGRRFTRHFHKNGEPISEAAILSLYAYQVLDPSIKPSDIDREMKEIIRVRNGGDPFR